MAMSNPPSNQPSNAQGSFGAMLQRARQDKQLSLQDVASELFILKRHLQALEDEDFAELPQVAFARGFAINYAKFLGLDPVRVASSFDAAYPNELKTHAMSDSESPLRPMGTLQRDTNSRIRFNPLLIIAVIGLIILAVFLYRMVSSASEDNQETEVVVEDLSAIEQAQGAAISQNNGVGASGSALNLGATEAAGSLPLQVNITGTTNVDITDATGNTLMSGSQISGNYQLLGTPPFNIAIDNINNVSLLLNQQTIDLTQYASGEQASFVLNP